MCRDAGTGASRTHRTKPTTRSLQQKEQPSSIGDEVSRRLSMLRRPDCETALQQGCAALSVGRTGKRGRPIAVREACLQPSPRVGHGALGVKDKRATCSMNFGIGESAVFRRSTARGR
ncbi:hypothetical protein SVAN01_00085 [Stagonosporopsis vannaccii]|nr:hypothetical protein SVAN01_00085 [Stagonosporopsis vannaccii]